jgi:hypothetical protein
MDEEHKRSGVERRREVDLDASGQEKARAAVLQAPWLK